MEAAQEAPEKPLLGFVDHIGCEHVHGWVMDPDAPGRRINVEVFLPETGESFGIGTADQFHHGISGIGDGSRRYGFWLQVKRALTQNEQKNVQVREVGGRGVPFSPHIGSWHPLLHVAMDIVDNCNLRCPFCLYDYRNVRKTNLMSRETLEAALRLLPYTRDGEFWFSCLHEPSLHPDLLAFLDAIPESMRKKVFFTSNIARRQSEAYFQGLAQSGIDHINISLESRRPEIYERMRKGARFPIFMENWDKLITAFHEANSAVALRYVIMAYKSNFQELPALTQYLVDERRAAQVEIRHTYDVPFIAPAFREQEFLTEEDWDWLHANLPTLEPGKLLLDRPPVDAPSVEGGESQNEVLPSSDVGFLPGQYLARLTWDGTLELKGISRASVGSSMIEVPILTKNIKEIDDIEGFFRSLHEVDVSRLSSGSLAI